MSIPGKLFLVSDWQHGKFVIGLVSVVVAVLSETILVSPSNPECSLMTRAIGHLHGRNRSFVSRTSEPTCMLCDG